jgi:arylformamidase
MAWIDISMPLSEGTPRFPGDPPVVMEPLQRIDLGAPSNLSRWVLGSHAGTHVDAPSHFFRGAPSVDRLSLDTLAGPCLVVGGGADGRSVTAEELGKLPPGTTRVLLKTPNSLRWSRSLEYFDDYVELSEGGAARLLSAGVKLVGIDALSVESDPTGRFPIHRLLLSRGVVILEGLLLEAVREGASELACFPLALRDGDGAPVRAAVRPL